MCEIQIYIYACFYLFAIFANLWAHMCLWNPASIFYPSVYVCVTYVSLPPARQVRDRACDPALKDKSERGWFCIHGDRESRSRKPTGSQGVPHPIRDSPVVMTLCTVAMETLPIESECWWKTCWLDSSMKVFQPQSKYLLISSFRDF